MITTKEQSERLILAGLDPDTCDWFYINDAFYKRGDRKLSPKERPAWSIERMWVLLRRCPESYEFESHLSIQELRDAIVNCLLHSYKNK